MENQAGSSQPISTGQQGFVLQSQAQLEDLVRKLMAESTSKGIAGPPKLVGKRKCKRSPSPVSSLSSLDASSPDGSLLPKRAKEQGRKFKSRTPAQQSKKKGPLTSGFLDPWQSDTPESSDSSREDGELSGEDDMDTEESGDRLFLAEMLPRLLSNVMQTLGLAPAKASDAPPVLAGRPASRFMPTKGPNKPTVLPFPDSFKQVMEAEWQPPSRSRCTTRAVDRLYSLPEDVTAMLKVPLVDQPMAALSSAAVLPSEGEGGPKIPATGGWKEHSSGVLKRQLWH